MQRRRGAPLKGEISARERILNAADTLFYHQGIRSIGIDTVIAESGVSKASLYRAFSSKDALIEAFVIERDRRHWAWWDKLAQGYADNSLAMLDAVLCGIAKHIGSEHYRGCPFLNVLTEFPQVDHPARIAALANKQELKRRLLEICQNISQDHSEKAADQLFLLINGAYSTGAMLSITALQAALRDGAARIVDNA